MPEALRSVQTTFNAPRTVRNVRSMKKRFEYGVATYAPSISR